MKRLNFIAVMGVLLFGLFCGAAQATINTVTVKDVNLNVLQSGAFVNASFRVNTPLNIGDFVEFQDNVSNVGRFTRNILFSLSGASAAHGFLTSFKTIAGLDLNIIGGPVSRNFDPNTRTYTFSGLSSGITYSLIASGRATTPHAGIAGSFQVLAVPEPEEWAMMVVGVSLVAFQIRRKHKALGLGHGTLSG